MAVISANDGSRVIVGGKLHVVAAAVLSGTLLLWPALWNGYPLVFSDTGTYLLQGIEHHLGWDRPPFYSLAILALHLTLTTWPVVITQALLCAHMLHLLCRALLPAASVWWLVPLCLVLTTATAAPWFAAQLMPDVFTPLLVIALALLALTPERLGRGERAWLIVLSAFMIAAHLSNLPLAVVLLAMLVPWRGCFALAHLARLAAPLAMACAALLAVNVAGHGRLSLSPYGNVFLLARVIVDGPGVDALRRSCPQAGWRLCAFRDDMPDDADDLIWRADGPFARAGGARAVAAEADAIIAASVVQEPLATARAAWWNFARQIAWFGTGDGLQAWPDTVTPPIRRDFPASEQAEYARALQTEGLLRVPLALADLHIAASLLGVVGCLVVLVVGRRRHRGRRSDAGGFAAAALLTVLVNAAITGCLSGPHDRYQSRVMWLPLAVALPALAAMRAPASGSRKGGVGVWDAAAP